MAGKILIYIAFISSVFSMMLFFASHLGKTASLKKQMI